MKKYIIITLAIAFVIELALTFLAFFMPSTAAELFQMKYSNENAFLVFIIAWFLLLVTVFIGYIIYLLIKNQDATQFIYIIGFWWLGLGVGVYFAFGKYDNLLLDSSKGILLLVLNYLNSKEKMIKA
jgi:hypothetical protein